MKKFLSIVLIAFSAAFSALSQIPATTPTDETKAPDWRVFAPAGEEFAVDIPTAFATEKYLGEDTNRRYYATFNQTYFFIFSDDLSKPEQANFVSGYVNGLRFRKPVDLRTIKPVKFGDIPAEKIIFRENDFFYHTILLFRTNARAYVFHVVSSQENDSLTERFFGSLKVNDLSGSESTVTAPITKPTATKTVAAIEAKRTAPTASPEPTRETKSPATTSSTNAGTGISSVLTIMSKPRPDYTDEARFYGIQGKIILRVIFLSTGEIGRITEISRLPFGLTERAVEAARAMRFKPLVRDGSPRSVAKDVEYNFLIY